MIKVQEFNVKNYFILGNIRKYQKDIQKMNN